MESPLGLLWFVNLPFVPHSETNAFHRWMSWYCPPRRALTNLSCPLFTAPDLIRQRWIPAACMLRIIFTSPLFNIADDYLCWSLGPWPEASALLCTTGSGYALSVAVAAAVLSRWPVTACRKGAPSWLFGDMQIWLKYIAFHSNGFMCLTGRHALRLTIKAPGDENQTQHHWTTFYGTAFSHATQLGLKILVRGWKQFSEHRVEMNQKLLQACLNFWRTC